MIGKNILHYKIIEKLGEGGMGIVYKAEDTKLNRLVAIKVLPPHLLVSEDDRARFHREAKAAAALNHSNIATVYEINETDEKPFIVMEYVEGTTLDQTIAKRPMKLEDAIAIAIQVADGLGGAHKKGVVHRDIKATNILYSVDKKAKILDFGLAKTSMSTKLTQMGTTIGTVAYMSPEQVQGREVDHRTDLWSLGVLLYEMIAGHLPFKAEYDQAIFYSIQNEEPEPLTAIRTGVPMALEWIVDKLMAKNPDERYQSAKDLIIDLKALDLSQSGFTRVSQVKQKSKVLPKQSKPGPVKTNNIIPWSVAGLFILITIITVFLFSPWSNTKQDENPVHFEMIMPSTEMMDITVYSSVAVSPDGQKFVFRANNQLYYRNLNQLKIIPLEGTQQGGSPFFSPDGRWLGFFADGKLKKISLSGGAPVVLSDASDNRGACWGENGDIVFAPITTTGLYRIKETGGSVEQITKLDTSVNERTHRWPCFLPDGKTVLFTVGTNDSPDYYEDSEIKAFNLQTGETKTILHGASTVKYLPEGYLVFSHKAVLYAVRFDINDLQVTGKPVNIIDNLNGDATSGAMHYDVSQNGTLAYIPGNSEGGQRNIIKIDMQGNTEILDFPLQSYLEPRISPDGKKVAITIGSGKDFDIWTFDLDKGNLTRLTFGNSNRSPIWSPDNTQIAYYSKENNKSSLKVKKADGSGEEKIIKEISLPRAYINGWTPDGKTLIMDIYQGADQSGIASYTIGTDEDLMPVVYSPADEWMSDLSPDGKWLAYCSNETGPYEVFVQPFPTGGGGKWQVSINGGTEPRWADNGRKLFYIKGNNIVMVPVSTKGGAFKMGREVVLFKYSSLPVDSGITYDITPDGKYCITTTTANSVPFKNVNVIVNWPTEIKNIFKSIHTNI